MVMSSSSNPIGAVEPTSGLAGFASNAVQALKKQEQAISDGLTEGLAKSGPVMKMPDHIKERFRVWEDTFDSPEDLARVAEVKQRVTAMMESTTDYVASTVERKTQKVQLELAMKAVSKSTQGIQQLLSAQ